MKGPTDGEFAPLVTCLNPCYNGIKMKASVMLGFTVWFARLNPCYNGIKMKAAGNSLFPEGVVCLNPCYNGIKMKEFVL